MNEVFEDKLPFLISIIRSTYYTKTIGNNGWYSFAQET